MNIFKKLYCRVYQGVFKIMIPLLPYREPKILNSSKDVVNVLKENNISSILLVTDKGIKSIGLINEIENEIRKSDINICVYDGTVQNPTTQNVNEALQQYKDNKCEALIAVGGGSVMDCAKGVGAKIARPNKSLSKMKGVLKVRRKIPLLIAVPTTAGTGSETTLAAVITDSETRHKYAINDFPLIPRYALLDPNLTVGLPSHITSTTGMDALTHAIEAYIGRSTTKQTRKYALLAIKDIFENLTKVYENPKDVEARKKMLVAAYNAGVAFTKSYVGYVHAIAHTLGGKYNTPHGLANAVILPYVLKSYGKTIYKKLWKIGNYCGLFNKDLSHEEGAKIVIQKIENMNKQMNIPNKIEGIKEEDIIDLVTTAEKEGNPLYPVPVIWGKKELEKIHYQIKKDEQ